MREKVFILKEDTIIKFGKNASDVITVSKNTELVVVTDVVYMSGFPVQEPVQSALLKYIKENKNNLIDDTRIW
jgi:hypothetical protein